MIYLKNVSTLEYNTSKCTGCTRCEQVCPRGVFVMDGNKARITDKDLCMECGACQKNCAHDAIKVDAGVGCAQALIYAENTGEEACCG
ncbi:MAG: mercury methylation ferredoxin HgcB [Deltaproteobacteria bacterium]|nr:mercury methylation ferredoxin HgcB [Deltaproteobacteria bacterium]